MTQFNTGPAEGVKPVAWVLAQPDGTLTYELLRDDKIEQVRKDCGAWRALYTVEQIERFAALVRERYREELLGAGVEPIHHEMHAGVCVGYFSAEQLAAAVLRAKEHK